MDSKQIVPTTIEGIKRLANTFRKENPITHSQALNFAARAAGYENFRHAQKHLLNESK